jgi:hypothetical protein
MYTGNVWGIALIVAGFLAALIAFQLLMQAVFPGWARRADDELRRRTTASALVGAGVLVVTVLVAAVAFAVFGKLGAPAKAFNALIVAALSFPLAMALGVVSRFVGGRMPSPADVGRPWRATLRGGVTCALAFVTPLVGWFVLLPAAVATGFGAMTLAAFASKTAPVAPEETPAEAAA